MRGHRDLHAPPQRSGLHTWRGGTAPRGKSVARCRGFQRKRAHTYHGGIAALTRITRGTPAAFAAAIALTHVVPLIAMASCKRSCRVVLRGDPQRLPAACFGVDPPPPPSKPIHHPQRYMSRSHSHSHNLLMREANTVDFGRVCNSVNAPPCLPCTKSSGWEGLRSPR
jgi:hypothetical protein